MICLWAKLKKHTASVTELRLMPVDLSQFPAELVEALDEVSDVLLELKAEAASPRPSS